MRSQIKIRGVHFTWISVSYLEWTLDLHQSFTATHTVNHCIWAGPKSRVIWVEHQPTTSRWKWWMVYLHHLCVLVQGHFLFRLPPLDCWCLDVWYIVHYSFDEGNTWSLYISVANVIELGSCKSAFSELEPLSTQTLFSGQLLDVVWFLMADSDRSENLLTLCLKFGLWKDQRRRKTLLVVRV